MENLLADFDGQRRFGGLDRLYGALVAGRIRSAHVAVVGVGGVGSWAAEALARSGVGQITLIDMDHIAESNINRQVHALTLTLGMAKIEAMRERIHLINPECRLHCVDAFVDPSNWPALLPDGVSAVIDACDNVQAKIAMSAWARRTRANFVCVGAAGGKKMGHKVDVCDLAEVSHDPLLAKLRYTLRKNHAAPRDGKKIGVACVFSREAVQQADATCDAQSDGSLNCHGYGSLVSVTATFGLCAAGWLLDRISAKT